MTTTYFAYGSNLDLEGKLRRWAPSATLLGTGVVPGRRLAFTRRSTRWGHRAADLLPAPGRHTWGALFAIADTDLPGLDACEGAPWNYRRLTVEVRTEASAVPALTYEVVDRHLPEAAPSDEYLETMLRGARATGLPDAWIAAVDQRVRRLGAGSGGG